MDWNKFIEGGWEGIVVILGILGFVGSIFNHSRAEAKEKAKKAAPKPKHVHTQTTRKPTKRNVTQGTFTQSKQNKELENNKRHCNIRLKKWSEKQTARKKQNLSIACLLLINVHADYADVYKKLLLPKKFWINRSRYEKTVKKPVIL